MAKKLFYSMGEVAEMFDVNRSLIRHWESQFSVLKPRRTARGNRLFSPKDVENLKVIYHLVKERGMTLEGAERAMKRRSAGDSSLEREAELMTRLKQIRALLAEVREDLKAGGEGIIADEESAAGPAAAEVPAAAPKPRRRKPVVKFGAAEETPSVEESAASQEAAAATSGEKPAEASAAETPEQVPEPAAETSAADVPVPGAGKPKPRPATPRRPRRKPNDDEDKELFAFYEQSLF